MLAGPRAAPCALTQQGAPAAVQTDIMSMSSPVIEMKGALAPEQLPAPVKKSGIGTVSMPITARRDAQEWFNQGLNLLHDFWDYEAARTFEQAVRAALQCAMCHWGLYRAESFYHSSLPDFAALSLAKAERLMDWVSERERLYIDAEVARQAATNGARGRMPDVAASVAIWRMLVREYPDRDTQARIFLAKRIGYGKEGLALLEGVLQEEPDNSAAHHQRVHALELSGRTPARISSQLAHARAYLGAHRASRMNGWSG
jgi:hypothetical protein